MVKDALLQARSDAATADTLKDMREYALGDAALTRLLMEVSPNDPIFAAGVAANAESRTFCGIPIVIDRSLPDNVIELRGGARDQNVRLTLG
jgi:hypothetical protein